MTDGDLAKELQDASRALAGAQKETFFLNQRGYVCWGDPTPRDWWYLSRTVIIPGNHLLAENLNKTIASVRAAYIGACEDRVRKAKEALVQSL